MSYNVDTWHTKKLDGFTLTLREILSFGPEIKFLPEGKIEIRLDPETSSIKGVLLENYDTVVVSEIIYCGEGSGHFWDNFKKILSTGKGILEAVQVWEGGDSITRLIVVDGKVSESNVEL